MSSLHHIGKNRRLSVTTKTRICQTPEQFLLLYAAGTWTLLSVNARALGAFHMKCQRQLQQIEFVRNDAISATTGLPSISESISHRRNALFGHVARLPDDVPRRKALNCQVSLSLGQPQSSQWHRRPGRPHNRWVDQIRNDNNLPPLDLWRRAVSRGYCGAMLRPSPTKRWQQQQQQRVIVVCYNEFHVLIFYHHHHHHLYKLFCNIEEE